MTFHIGHTTSIKNLRKILDCGFLMSVEEQKKEFGKARRSALFGCEQPDSSEIFQFPGIFLTPFDHQEVLESISGFATIVFRSDLLSMRKDWHATSRDTSGLNEYIESSVPTSSITLDFNHLTIPSDPRESWPVNKTAEYIFHSRIPIDQAVGILVSPGTKVGHLPYDFGLPLSRKTRSHEWKGLSPVLREVVTDLPEYLSNRFGI